MTSPASATNYGVPEFVPIDSLPVETGKLPHPMCFIITCVPDYLDTEEYEDKVLLDPEDGRPIRFCTATEARREADSRTPPEEHSFRIEAVYRVDLHRTGDTALAADPSGEPWSLYLQQRIYPGVTYGTRAVVVRRPPADEPASKRTVKRGPWPNDPLGRNCRPKAGLKPKGRRRKGKNKKR